MNYLYFILLFFLVGCVEKKIDISQKKDSHIANNCGVTHLSEFTPEFKFDCGIDNSELDIIKDLSSVILKKEQVCDVYYSENGQPKTFLCKEKKETIDSFIAKGASFNGSWTCKGLDGYGGYDINESDLVIYDNDRFKLFLKAKKTTDSIWFLTDSIISGDFNISHNSNKVILTPLSWSSELLKLTNMMIKDAPKNMLVKPLIIEIKSFTNNNLTGVSRWSDNLNYIVSHVSCSRKI